MQWKSIILPMMAILIMCGAAFAQQEVGRQDNGQVGEIPGISEEHRQPVQRFTGTVDRQGEDYVLNTGDRTYGLDFDDREMVDSLVGHEVEVRGTLEEGNIQAETLYPAEVVPEMQQGVTGRQPMGEGTPEQPMGGNETDLGPGGVAAPGWQHQPMERGAEQPMEGQAGNQTGW
jgi:hypothetical protein